MAPALGLAALTGVAIFSLEALKKEVSQDEAFWVRIIGGTLLGGAGIASFFMSPSMPKNIRFLPYLVGVVGVGAGLYYLTRKEPPTPTPGTLDRPQSPEDYKTVQVDIEKPLPNTLEAPTHGLFGTYYSVQVRWTNLGSRTVPFSYRFRITEVPILTELGREMSETLPSVTSETVYPENNSLILAPGTSISKEYEVERLISPWDATEIIFAVDMFNAFTGDWKEVSRSSFVTRVRERETS